MMTTFEAAASFPAGSVPLADLQQRLAVLEHLRAAMPDASVETLTGMADWACSGARLDSDRLTAAAKALAAADEADWGYRKIQARYLGLAARTVTAYLASDSR